MESACEQDYLRVMGEHLEGETGEGMRVNDIAKRLRVSKASVSQMMGRLLRKGLIIKSRYSAIRLSERGMQASGRVMRRHRIIEVFLERALGLHGHELEREVHALEHAFSDEAIERLDEYLGRPERCPHGNMIPPIR